MGFGSHVEIYKVAVGGGIGEGDGLRHGIAGHDVLKAAEQIGLRVLAAGLKVKAL